MARVNSFSEFLAASGGGASDSASLIDFAPLFKEMNCDFHRVTRTIARDRFHSLADSNDITIVTNHERAEGAVVIMRGKILAGLLDSVAAEAVKRASQRRPLLARLEGLKPVPSYHQSTPLHYDTRQGRHQLHVDVVQEVAAES